MTRETVSVVWKRPDGREGVRVDFPMPDKQSARALIEFLLGRERCARCGGMFGLSREQVTARIRGLAPLLCESCGARPTEDEARQRPWSEAERTREAMLEDAQTRDEGAIP